MGSNPDSLLSKSIIKVQSLRLFASFIVVKKSETLFEVSNVLFFALSLILRFESNSFYFGARHFKDKKTKTS